MFFYSNLSVWGKRVQAPKGLIPHWLLLLRTPGICSSFGPAAHHPSLSSRSMQRGWSCLGCMVPLVPTPRVRDKPQPFSVLPAASRGWGQELPGRAGPGLAFARSWGGGGEAGGEASMLPSHLLPHQMLLPGTGMGLACAPTCHGMGSLAGEHCCNCHHCPQDQEQLGLPLLHARTDHLGPLLPYSHTICLLPSSCSSQ